jgi:hypothetical protein
MFYLLIESIPPESDPDSFYHFRFSTLISASNKLGSGINNSVVCTSVQPT